MRMFELITESGIVFDFADTLLGCAVTALFAVIIDRRKEKRENEKSLKADLKKAEAELEKAKEEISALRSLEAAEGCIDKSCGTLYYEKLASGKQRAICGYCWEKSRIKIPIVTEFHYEQYTGEQYYQGVCASCKSLCIDEDIVDEEEGELPF